MKREPASYLVGLGSYLPERVMTNADFERLVDTSDEWITTRTGIKERRIAADNETTSDMGYQAAVAALQDAGVEPEALDLILVTTMSPDYPCPSTACLLQGRLGASRAGAADVGAACSGFLYGLSIASAFVESGKYKNILVVAAEKMSSVVDYTDRSTCVLFGDGAAAGIVSDEARGFLIENQVLAADGANGMIMTVPAGGSACPASEETISGKKHYFRMNGPEVFKNAIRCMESVALQCMTEAGLGLSDVDWLIPHQANTRIISAMAKRSPISTERVYNEVWRYGNTSAPSVALALNDLLKEKEVVSGERLLLVAFGAGLTWGASLLRKL